jgi:hypothetical protein
LASDGGLTATGESEILRPLAFSNLVDAVMDSSNNSDKVLQKDNGGEAGAPVSVLVVGAGPTGLLLASEFERRGVRCHLIDARPGPMHWDRATVVHPRSLQIFESLGGEMHG